jgi:hypothetical protein
VGLPVLVAEMRTSRAFAAQGPAGQLGDLTDLLVSGLLERGFTLVTRLREAPRKAAAWSAVISPGAGGAVQVDITDPAGGLFYTGTAYLPDRWPDAAQRLGWCVLYSGVVELPRPGAPGVALRVLRSAAAAGGLVGARVAVGWSSG